MRGCFVKPIRVYDLYMIKGITIRLKGPICTCDHQNLGWTWTTALMVTCKSCKTTSYVPTQSVQASFQLDEEYPEKVVKTPVIRLVTKDEDGTQST